MDSKELRGLMEAYSEVYAPQQIDELSNRKLRAYIKKSGKSHAEINKKWDQGTATDREKSKSIGHEIGQQRAFRTLDKRTKKEEFELWVDSLVEEGYDLSDYTMDEMFDIYLDEAEGSYGATPKAYSAASKTKMTAKRKPFLKAMKSRTNPVGTSMPNTARKGMTADDRERARAGAAYGVGTRQDHDYPSEGPGGVTKSAKKLRKQKALGEIGEELEIFDVVLEFLQVEGYADTLEEAEWVMANLIDEEAIDIILGEAIYSRKGLAKAAEMIAKRSTPSGRAKSGKGADVAQIRQIRGSGRGYFDREGLGGTPMTPTMAKNPIKKQSDVGTGNKAARRAAALRQEEFELWVDDLVEEGYDLSDYTWDEMYEFYLDEAEKPFPHEKVKAKQVALRDKGGNALDRRMKMGMAVRRAKEAEKTGGSQRDAGKGWYHAKEAFEAWLDEAMTNYEKNRKRAAQRAAARNAARDQGKTGAVPGVGYVTPRRERETWTDESGKTRHAKGL